MVKKPFYQHTPEELFAAAKLLAPRPGETTVELHNRIGGMIVAALVRPTLELGGSPSDILVLTESVLFGVLDFVGEGAEFATPTPAAVEALKLHLFDTLVSRVRERLADQRLAVTRPEGSA